MTVDVRRSHQVQTVAVSTQSVRPGLWAFRRSCFASFHFGRVEMFPPKDRLTICFAHVAYQLQERFLPRKTGISSFTVRTNDEFERRIGEADIVVVSGMWKNDLLERAAKLRFIQSIGAGTDQFDRDKLTARGIR